MNSYCTVLLTFFLFGYGNSIPASKSHGLNKNYLMDSDSPESTPPVAKYFDQDIDHSGKIGGTFKQLYYESLCEEGENDDIKFLYIGGETALSTGAVSMNFMSQLADHFLADKYALEHRFYGQSQPFTNISTANLEYLTINQSLEDIRNFVEFINSKTPKVHVKWILFGGSYAGNLAVWARMQYPELILGAIASSAPVQAQVNFKEYLINVAKIIDTKDQQCKAILKQGMTKLVHIFGTKQGKDQLKSKFKMCKHPNDQYDKYTLTSYIVDLFNDAVEYNIKSGNADRLTLLCQDLKQRKGDNLEKLISLVVEHYTAGSDCFNYNYDSIQGLFQTQINEYNFERQWLYQKCTELGYFETTDSNNQPFAHSLPFLYYTKMCKDAFGGSFSEQTISAGVEKTNMKYKGKDVRNATNLVMVHGSSDPWKDLGLVTFTTETSKTIIIKDGWHCQDMIIGLEKDPEELIKSREEITKMIAHWTSH